MRLFATLLVALALALIGSPAGATPVMLATHYSPSQLAAFCAKVDGTFTNGKHYDCRTICSSDGDACGVFCGATACLALAPVQLSNRTTPYLVLETHKTGLLSPGDTDPWVLADKKDPKPKPPPPPKEVLDGNGGTLDGVDGESKDDKHKGEIEILSIGSGSGGNGGGGNGGGLDSGARANPPAEHSPGTTGASGGSGPIRTNPPGTIGQ